VLAANRERNSDTAANSSRDTPANRRSFTRRTNGATSRTAASPRGERRISTPRRSRRDFLGSEFGNRHAEYEKFYGGASFLVKQNVNRFYDYKRATSLVDAALALPPVA
jgi:hypothetical protein